MSIQKITFEEKSNVRAISDRSKQVVAQDLNEIKAIVNALITQINNGLTQYSASTFLEMLLKIRDTDVFNEISLSIESNILKLKNGTQLLGSADLSLYLDDTNLARLTSGTIDSNNVATFLRDDGSSFTLDLSNLAGITSVGYENLGIEFTGVKTIPFAAQMTIDLDTAATFIINGPITSHCSIILLNYKSGIGKVIEYEGDGTQYSVVTTKADGTLIGDFNEDSKEFKGELGIRYRLFIHPGDAANDNLFFTLTKGS